MATNGFRVMHVTDYASAYEGAFIRQLRMLDEEVRSRGGRPSALCLTARALDRPWREVLEADGWELRELPEGATRGQGFVASSIVEAARELRPDVIHVHFGTYDLSARTAIRRLRRQLGANAPRLVWHYRTALEEPVAERGPLRRAKDHLKFTRAGRDVDLFVGVTRALGREVADRGAPADRCRGIVAGCDTDTFRRDVATRRRVRDELGVSEEDILVLHMGWSWHRKGGDLLAEAMRSLEAGTASGDLPRIVACSIGAPEDALLGSVRALPITDRVHEFHAAADIFVSASRSEGFGNGLVEAMASERVAVAAAAEGQLETFAGIEGVVTMPVDDAPALARALRTLVARRSEWGRLGVANRRHVVERHSMRRWAADMADAYAELLPARLAPHLESTTSEVA
ncbi:MAG: glycosyl transferase group 1 [Thermoleophilia bacterium]|nr:glycosyl transferase group 1 [Thermoleophilia bacterium]